MANIPSIDDEIYVEKVIQSIMNFSRRLKTPKNINPLTEHFKISSSNVFGQNIMNYLFEGTNDTKQLEERCQSALHHIESSKRKVVALIEKKIVKKSIVMTASYSPLIIDSLKEAKKFQKIFHVAVLETRPFMEGRRTAQELSKNDLDVHYFIDQAARVITKKADICLLPCNHITNEGKIYTFLGGEMIAELCHKRNVALYILTNGWKFDGKNIFKYDEKRTKEAIWEKAPKNVT
ncbi:MAG: hypothetical protein QW331_02820, partial [Candidatus Woesearchaeota archaeon]